MVAATETLIDEQMWAGWFGVQYTTKFAVDWRERIPFLRRVIEATGARSIADVGTNAGWNLRALEEIDSTLELRGLEINPHTAASAMVMGFNVEIGAAHFADTLLAPSDLVMTSGVLIHVRPELLAETMRSIIAGSRQWVLAVEYHALLEHLVREPRDGAPRTWARPFGQMYEELGLRTVDHGWSVAGYPECDYWLMRKP